MIRPGEAIRSAREAAGLSQQALAERIGLATNASISNLERGVAILTVETAIKIADACGVSRATFLARIAEGVHDAA